MFYLITLNVLRNLEVVPLIQDWFKGISCIVRVESGLYVKTLVIDGNQRMPGSDQEELVIVSTTPGLYLDTKWDPVCGAPDWQSRQLSFVVSIEISWWEFWESFMSMIIFSHQNYWWKCWTQCCWRKWSSPHCSYFYPEFHISSPQNWSGNIPLSSYSGEHTKSDQ